MIPPLVSILSQLYPNQTLPVHFPKILILSSSLLLIVTRGLFPSGFPTKVLYEFISPVCATCLAHLIFLDLIILIIFGEAYNRVNISMTSSTARWSFKALEAEFYLCVTV